MSEAKPTASAPVSPRSALARPDAQQDDPGADVNAFFDALLRMQVELAEAEAGAIYLVGSTHRNAGLASTYLAPSAQGLSALDKAILSRLQQVGAKAAEGPAELDVVESHTIERTGGLYEPGATHRILACPLTAAEQIHGSCVLLVPTRSPIPPEEALTRVRLTLARYEAFLWRQSCFAEANSKTRLRETVELLDAAQQGANAPSMGSMFCSELQRRFGCTRVSIGLVKRHAIRMAAVSGTEDLDKRGPAAEAIEAAMEECAEQDAEIIYPQPAELSADAAHRRITLAHEQLSNRFGPSAVLSLPLRVEGDIVGVVTLERAAADPFPAAALPVLRLVAEFIGPSLWTRRLADRGMLAVARDRSLDLAAAAVGTRHTVLRSILMLVLITLIILTVLPIPSRVSSDAELGAGERRLVPAPFAGYLDEVLKEPGDDVKAGEVLARMETDELRLRLADELATEERFTTEKRQAEARREIDIAAAKAAEIKEVRARIALLEDQIDRAAIRAPIDGRVAQGELELLRGARVDPSNPLFEIIDPTSTLVVIQVDERDVRRVYVDLEDPQTGHVSLSANPGERIAIEVTSIRPTADAVRGSNVYLVEARLLDPPEWVRPGLTGVAKLDDGTTTPMAAIMSPVVDAVRLRLWW